jgi:fluoroacetyl-CoA thioesterase
MSETVSDNIRMRRQLYIEQTVTRLLSRTLCAIMVELTMEELKIGMSGETSHVVKEQDTAAKIGSGLVAAYSTPSMIALMEKASVAAIQPYLSEGRTSVGVEVDIKHLAATPVGMQVRARASLVEIDKSRLKFRVEAWDEKEKIGEGSHVRAILDTLRFEQRLKRKTGAGVGI